MLACERHGSGEPLVVLNGYAAALSDWDPGFMAALEAERELVLVDHRPLGPGPQEAGVQLGAVEVEHAGGVRKLAQLEVVDGGHSPSSCNVIVTFGAYLAFDAPQMRNERAGARSSLQIALPLTTYEPQDLRCRAWWAEHSRPSAKTE